MRFTPLRHGGVGVDRGPGKRMTELDGARAQRDHSRAFRSGQRGEVDPEAVGGAFEHRQIAAVAGGGEHQCAAGGFVEQANSPHERARDACGDKHRGTFGRERELVRVRRQLEQRERVAICRTVQLMSSDGRQPAQQQFGIVDRRPPIRSVGRSAPSSNEGSPSRTAISTAIGSATSRRKANSSA